MLDRLRAEEVAARKEPLLVVEAELAETASRVVADAGEVLVDERLRLVLLCAHPSLSREAAAALTLRLVLGVATEDLARLFLVPTTTMAARLTRARRKLAGQRFTIPPATELPGRVAAVADVAYLAFTAGYAPGSGPDVLRADVAGEAVRLVRVLREVLAPRARTSELDALLALVLLQHSRRDARVRDGRLVLLPDQDRRAWHHEEVQEALELLRPWVAAPPAPYLLQALVAAEHAIAPSAEETAWERVVAVAELDGPGAGLRALEGVALPGHRLPATRAELLARAGRHGEARTAYDAAVALCRNDAERAHLLERRDRLGRPERVSSPRPRRG